MATVHATCVGRRGAGILLRGASGAGKSDLALRLVDRGWRLVADDQVCLTPAGRQLIARPPATLAGLLEARGAGILRIAHATSMPVALVVDLRAAGEVERMPMPPSCTVEGCSLPRIEIDPFEAGSTEKITLALEQALCGNSGGVQSDRGLS